MWSKDKAKEEKTEISKGEDEHGGWSQVLLPAKTSVATGQVPREAGLKAEQSTGLSGNESTDQTHCSPTGRPRRDLA